MSSSRAIGRLTRGTTNLERLRRIDRFVCARAASMLRQAGGEVTVADVGFGARVFTSIEWGTRLAQSLRNTSVRHVRVVAIDISPDRVRGALRDVEQWRNPLSVRSGFPRVSIEPMVGGFDVCGERAHVIRAANVLRQYDEGEVAEAWSLLAARLMPAGFFVDATCDELGRRAAWVTHSPARPESLTLSYKFGHFEKPSDVAERLPKALIHRNVPGEKVFDVLQAADAAWRDSAPLSTFGNRQRFTRMCELLAAGPWGVKREPSRWRLGELTIAWRSVAPK